MSTIPDNNGTGQEGEGQGGGEYDGECLLNNNHDDNEYDNDNKTMMQRMGRGCTGEWRMGGIRLRWLQCCQRAIHWGGGR